MEVTLNLPKKVYMDLSKSAKKSKRTFDEFVSEKLQNSVQTSAENPLSKSSDKEVLEAAKLWIPESQSEKHSELLYKNQADSLTDTEKKELKFFSRFTKLHCSEKRKVLRKRYGAD